MFSGTPSMMSTDVHLPVDLNPDSIEAITKSNPKLNPASDNTSYSCPSPEEINDWDSTL